MPETAAWQQIYSPCNLVQPAFDPQWLKERQAKMFKYIAVLSLFLAVYASPTDKVIKNRGSPNRIPSEYLVTVRPNMYRGQSLKHRMDLFVQNLGSLSHQISILNRYDFTKLSVLRIKAESLSPLMNFYSLPGVTSIEANLYEKAIDQDCQEQETISGLWGLARIAKREESNDNTYSFQEGDGEGGYVYVVDSGIRVTHTDFGDRAIHGYTSPSISEGDDDLNGHGTHCAGTVMGTTYGVAKYAGAIAVKTLDRYGMSSISMTIGGLEWIQEDFAQRNQAADGNLPAVVSMSLRFSPSDAMDGVLQELFDAGLITTASAGNQASSSCNQSPATNHLLEPRPQSLSWLRMSAMNLLPSPAMVLVLISLLRA